MKKYIAFVMFLCMCLFASAQSITIHHKDGKFHLPTQSIDSISFSMHTLTSMDTTLLHRYVDVYDSVHHNIILNDTTVNHIVLNDTTINHIVLNDTTRNGIIVNDTTVNHVVLTDTLHNQVVINDTIRFNAGHEYVDLGLSVKWATFNIGASAAEDYGLYFAWGETTGYAPSDGHNFAWASYEFGTSSTALTKYCLSSTYGTVDNKTILESTDDAACLIWGGNWRMPTFDEITELKTECTMTLASLNGVKGYKFTASNGNSIFLPATGYFKGTTHLGETTYLGYWSKNLFGTQSGSDSRYAYCLEYCDEFNSYETDYRCRGFCIRPVCP